MARIQEDNFHLEVDGWTSNNESNSETGHHKSSPPRKKRLCLSRNKGKQRHKGGDKNRWSFINDSDVQSLSTECIPKNMVIKTSWAISVFIAWKSSHNEWFVSEPEKIVPDILQSTNPYANYDSTHYT